jgi:protein ImuB
VVARVSRFACVWVECFVAAAAERSEPALRAEPLAVLAPAPTVTRVIDANAAAREDGVRGGMTETEARARCPALVSRPFVEEHVRSARHALLEAAFGVSPRVEDGGAGLVYVDAAGLARLHGDPVAIGRRLASQARAVGFPGCRVALAGSRTAARVVAVNAVEPVTVIPPGEERAALAKAPLAVLGLALDLAMTLEGWGVRTLGELAALPRDGLAMRLGPAGLRAHDLALGLDRDPFDTWAPPAFWEEAQGLEWEIDSLGALAVVLDAVLARLCARLVAASLAADALDVRLELASGGHHARVVALAVPMREAKPMLALLALDLEAHPPSAAVTRVTVSARPVRARAGQGGLWQPPAPRLRDLVAVLARLAVLVGPDNVGSPRLDDSHRPDAYTMTPFSPPDGPGGAKGAGPGPGSALRPRGRRDPFPPTGSGPRAPRWSPAATEQRTRAAWSRDPWGGGRTPGQDPPLSDEGRLVLRRVRPPRRVVVATADERPSRVDGRCVVGCVGPWRASGAWWDMQAWARDEWDVALGDGTLCRLACDLRTGQWCVDGVYD